MSKTYILQGPIMLENLSNTAALGFVGAVVAAIPSYSMGSARLNIHAQGPAGTANGSAPAHVISGKSVDELTASLAKAQAAPKAPEDIVYDIRGSVSLVGLTFEDGMQVIDAVMNAIPTDSLVVTSMLAQAEAPPA